MLQLYSNKHPLQFQNSIQKISEDWRQVVTFETFFNHLTCNVQLQKISIWLVHLCVNGKINLVLKYSDSMATNPERFPLV